MNKIFSFLPDEIADLLPVIDIRTLLETYYGSNIFPIPGMADAFNCVVKETINVPAGSYEAYHIIIGEYGSIYFAPEVGNIIKISLPDYNIKLKKYTKNIVSKFV